MFNRYGKKGISSPTKPLKGLTRIVPPALLLSEEKRNTLLGQIRDVTALEEIRFDSLCLSLIHNLVNHCQSLPESSTSYYSQPGGLLDHALNRTEAALGLFRQFLIQEGQTALSEEQKLWQYALFSAGILQGIGKLQIDFKVQLYDNNGQFLKVWLPLLDNLTTVAGHYNYELLPESDENLRRRLNLLFAHLLMPASGFSWIVSNPQVLAIWLALLNEDIQGAGTLGAILVRADAISIQRYFNQLLARGYGSRGGRYGRVSTFTGIPAESVSDMEQQLGLEFLQWLTKALETGKVVFNKPPLMMVPGGMLMSAELFNWFMRDNPEYKSWQAVQNGFLSLGLHSLGPDGSIESRFEQSTNQQIHTGVVFADYAIALPPEVQLHNLRTGKTASISATDLIYQSQFANYFTRQSATSVITSMPHLNQSGQWQVNPMSSPTQSSTPGMNKDV